jgi:hypothetical protein
MKVHLLLELDIPNSEHAPRHLANATMRTIYLLKVGGIKPRIIRCERIDTPSLADTERTSEEREG